MSDLTASDTAGPAGDERTVVLVVVALVVGAAVAWLVWAIAATSRPQARSSLISFDVRGQHRVVARFAVVRQDRAVRANCLLRAYAVDHAVVGERQVLVGPAVPASTTLTRSVRTEREATSVDAHRLHHPGAEAPPVTARTLGCRSGLGRILYLP